MDIKQNFAADNFNDTEIAVANFIYLIRYLKGVFFANL